MVWLKTSNTPASSRENSRQNPVWEHSADFLVPRAGQIRRKSWEKPKQLCWPHCRAGFVALLRELPFIASLAGRDDSQRGLGSGFRLRAQSLRLQAQLRAGDRRRLYAPVSVPVMTDLVGWSAEAVLLLTIGRQ